MLQFDKSGFWGERTNMHKKKMTNITPYFYIAPITAILVGFVIVSVIISIVLSFTRYNIMTPPVYYGVKNYVRLLTDAKFLKALKNTLKLMIMIVPLQTILAIVISTFLVSNRHMLIGKIANSVIFIPVLCSNAVTGVVWKEMLNGKIPVIEKFFSFFGIKASMLLGDAKTVLAVVAAVAIWKSMGYYVVIYSSGLMGISDTYYEAAKVDGAGTLRRFFGITLPMLKPTIILALFLSITSSLLCFDLIYTMTGGGPNNASTTLVVYAYNLCFGSSAAGYAMALSNVLFLVILIIAMLQRGFMKREASEI